MFKVISKLLVTILFGIFVGKCVELFGIEYVGISLLSLIYIEMIVGKDE